MSDSGLGRAEAGGCGSGTWLGRIGAGQWGRGSVAAGRLRSGRGWGACVRTRCASVTGSESARTCWACGLLLRREARLARLAQRAHLREAPGRFDREVGLLSGVSPDRWCGRDECTAGPRGERLRGGRRKALGCFACPVFNSRHSVRACRASAREFSGGFGSGDLGPATRAATWLILPVVICLSQRLSHACLSINCLYCETANGSLNQL